jgi:hypothetical protein
MVVSSLARLPDPDPDCTAVTTEMRVELFACRAALEARALQHLLVLLLAHSFAPLLNERSHGGATLAVRGRLSETTIRV